MAGNYKIFFKVSDFSAYLAVFFLKCQRMHWRDQWSWVGGVGDESWREKWGGWAGWREIEQDLRAKLT